ncbi:WAT1-related protein At2g39510-like [Phoenix dactylifera]|uniref:WAT1-related protein n=1 Tax=Phoenix dactylifera TaxID=42345 RepID=A0A8B9ASQ0_PHODC|nr:WAT1-related protein At2g39510-like [Phoenix dactylifera]
MVLVQVVFVGVNLFYKLAMNDGMNMRVLVAYRYLFATAFLGPLAFFLERYNALEFFLVLLDENIRTQTEGVYGDPYGWYSGIWVDCTVVAWCIQRKGPLYASIFNPLTLVIVALLSSLLLNEKLHLGSILGAILIVAGLYTMLWGKGREAAKVGKVFCT